MLTPGPPHQPQPADAFEGANARRATATQPAKHAKPFFIVQLLPLKALGTRKRTSSEPREFLAERSTTPDLQAKHEGISALVRDDCEGPLWVKSRRGTHARAWSEADVRFGRCGRSLLARGQ